MKRNTLLLISILIAFSMLLTACQPAVEEPVVEEPVVEEPVVEEPVVEEPEVEEPQEVVEIVIWNTWSDHHVEDFQAILDQFNEENQYINVVQQQHPRDEFVPKVMHSVMQGVGPDLLSMHSGVVVDYVYEDLIVNLSELIDDPDIGIPGFDEMVPPGIYQTITQWDGNVYMMPEYAGGDVYYYNKTLFNELGLSVPETWDELEQISRVIYDELGIPGFGFDNEVSGFQNLIIQQSSGYINPETMTVEFNNPIAVERLEWFSDLVQEGVFRLVGEDMFLSGPFGSQAVASYIGSTAGYSFVRMAVDEQFEFGAAGIPQSEEKEFVADSGWGWVIFKSDEAQEKAAFEFLKYLITPEIFAGWAASFGATPAYYEAAEHPIFQEFAETNSAIKANLTQVDIVGHLPAVRGSRAVEISVGRAVSSTATGILTPAEALEIAEQEANAELAYYR